VTPAAGAVAPSVSLRLSPASRELRRTLGPTAWAVLEELLLGSTQVPEAPIAATSVRRLAEDLSVSKDTAARALKRLIGHGLLVRRPGGHSASGRFNSGGYEIRPERLAGVAVELAVPSPPVGRHRPRQRSPRQAQPALFELEEGMP
jgi:hypothetical protein